MHPVIAKTFGGLSKPYYFRQFFFGLLFSALIIFMSSHSTQGVSLWMVLFVAISTLYVSIRSFRL